jgi:hypothetical protein
MWMSSEEIFNHAAAAAAKHLDEEVEVVNVSKVLIKEWKILNPKS